MTSLPDGQRSKLPLLLLVGALVAGAVMIHAKRTRPQAAVSALVPVTANSDACADRERCVVVIVAPWCPHCAGAEPFIKELQAYFANSKSVGVKVVVGEDKRDKTVADAQGYSNAYVDDGDRFRKSTGTGTAVPEFIVLDEKQRVRSSVSGAPNREIDMDQIVVWLSNLGLDADAIEKSDIIARRRGRT